MIEKRVTQIHSTGKAGIPPAARVSKAKLATRPTL